MTNPIQNPKNNTQSLNTCSTDKTPLENKLNYDSVPKQCHDTGEPSQDRVDGTWESWLKEHSPNQKTGFGHHGQCDPMMTGQIINDPRQPNPNVVYRYARAIRGADEAMLTLFRDPAVVVLDEQGKAHNVPVIWGSQEKAVAAILQENVRKDSTLVVDRIRLPILSLYQSDMNYNQDRYTYSMAKNFGSRPDGTPAFTVSEKSERDTVFGVTRGVPVDISYTLYGWTMYQEDMNQIVEQIFTKFNPVAYINIRGINWEVIAKLDSFGNNVDTDPGDQAIRIMKFQFNMTLESYIPQPISRHKAVLKMKQEYVDGTNNEEITEVLEKIELAVKGLE
jgi:hypothetical protein